MPRPRPRARTWSATAALLAILLLGGCFRLVEHDTYAVGFESNRANLVIHANHTRLLHDLARRDGAKAARNVILAVTPKAFPISTRQRLLLCTISTALCLSAPQIGATMMRWFRSDIGHRRDFGEALSQAGGSRRCFAWTFLPRRNLTHKGLGTSGCARGGR
jgi:hypothetical protein